MPLLDIDSRPDPTGRFTRVTFDTTLATFAQVRLMRRTTTVPAEVYRMPIAPGQHPAFRILFRRYDMAAPCKNEHGAGVADYFATGNKNPQVTATGDGGWTITYGSIPAYMAPLPAWMGALPQHAPLVVTLTLRPAADGGWVDLDLRFSYPAEIDATAATHAWEPIVTFPSLHLVDAELAPHRLLDPAGALHNAAASGGVFTALPVQVTSLYREGREANGINHVTGVAVMGTDEIGHHKTLSFRRQPERPDHTRAPAHLELALRSPMHLDAARAYTHPDEWSLSGGDASGWGGAGMKWRIRAFRLEGAVPGQPMDWHDVAGLYRDWARTRTATLYRKHPTGRTENGPFDAMNPFTVIAHYSLQGDADPRVDPAVAGWLEQHPLRMGDGPDIPGNPNPGLIEMLDKVRDSVSPGMLLEAQIWGAEPDGYFRFLAGFPPRTNLIRSNPRRFLSAMNHLVGMGIVPLMTTDPLLPNFNRARFRGHLRLVPGGGWTTTIPAPFHHAVTAALAPRVNTVDPMRPCRNRVWQLVTTDPDFKELAAQRRVSETGQFPHNPNALSAFHGLEQYGVCPTPQLQDLYVNRWLKRGSLEPGGALDHGFRLLEFMKHHMGGSFCFNRGHDHLPAAAATADYQEVIGFGPWFMRRMEALLKATHAAGVLNYPSFSLVNEFFFPEVLVPYFNEYYDHGGSSSAVMHGDSRSLQLRAGAAAENPLGIPLQHFVYSPLVGLKGAVVEDDNLNHPGYTEVRRAQIDGSPAEMLGIALDETGPDAAGWVAVARAYFERAFDTTRTQHGLAPAGYPTAGGGTYTYSRAVQDVANLHSRIFRFGAAGVCGERIELPAAWYLEPADYTVDARNMGIRAGHMQMRFAPFFRKGWMLGQTEIVAGNRVVRAWRMMRRNFGDVAPLVADCGGAASISDAISRRIDVTKENQAALLGNEVRRVLADQVQHMVWQQRLAGGRLETLYVFANVGNTVANFDFRYTRGVDAGVALKGTVYRFNGSTPTPAAEATVPVVRGQIAKATLQPRTCLAVHITPA